MAHKAKHVKYAPVFVVTERIEAGDWVYTFDADWRALNERAGLRTRLKATRQAAEDDVKARRLQKYISGEWVDTIRS